MKKKNYLTEEEVENLKEACSEEDRELVRDLTDTGLSRKEILKKRARGEVLR